MNHLTKKTPKIPISPLTRPYQQHPLKITPKEQVNLYSLSRQEHTPQNPNQQPCPHP